MPEVEENDAKSYELAFEEAGRALDAQERAVNELRSRAGVLIAAAAITTSFFGSRAIVGDQLSAWVWIAVVAFIVVGGCVLSVLWPRSDCLSAPARPTSLPSTSSRRRSSSRSSSVISRCTVRRPTTQTPSSFVGCSGCSGSG